MLQVDPQIILDAIADRRETVRAEYDRKAAENAAAVAYYDALPWYKWLFSDRRDCYPYPIILRDTEWFEKHYRRLNYLCQYAVAIGQATIELPLEYSHLLTIPKPKPEETGDNTPWGP